MSAKLKIHQKWEDMAGYAYVVLRNMPKSERFTLGAEIRESIWKGIRLIVRATHARSKGSLLMELDTEIKTLQAMIRTGNALKVVDDRKYKNMSAMLTETGKMLGGWIKSLKYRD